MEPRGLHDNFHRDFIRLRTVASGDLTAPVPSCPGWTAEDLVRHLAEVYLHKVECIVQQRFPTPWPPPDLGKEPAIELLDRAMATLEETFQANAPDAPAATWYPPDQSVGWWMRRMTHETLIHRVDGELAAGSGIDPIAEDLAIDGIDELLECFLRYQSERWPEDFAKSLPTKPVTISIATRPARWLVTATPRGVELATVESGPSGPLPSQVTGPAGAAGQPGAAPAASLRGEPAAMLVWLWRRSGDGLPVAPPAITVDGDGPSVEMLRDLLRDATQ
jgi:uncharacterized protein (TIGR03083 family)